jgi:hypothetical protein
MEEDVLIVPFAKQVQWESLTTSPLLLVQDIQKRQMVLDVISETPQTINFDLPSRMNQL